MEYHPGIGAKTVHSMSNPRPPRWAERFLSWYCRPELLEDLQGDLNEYFERHCKSKGIRRAKLIYIADVFKFLRSYTIRKPDFINLIIHWIMVGSYIKTSGRSIVRNKLFSAINIIGLAISMSVGLLMIAFLTDLLSYDKFHMKGERIYRLTDTHTDVHSGHTMELASTSVAAGKRIKEGFAGAEDVTLIRRNFSGDASYKNNTISFDGLWADESFFNVFSFTLTKGDPETALREPYSIVLTEKEAKKIFGDEDPMGKSVTLLGDQFGLKADNKKNVTTDYIVTGLMPDVPVFSHLRFGALGSYATKEIIEKDNSGFTGWTNIWSNYCYILLPENAGPENLQAYLSDLSTKQNADLKNEKIQLTLQPLFEIALGKDLNNQIGPTMISGIVWIVGGLSFVVILSACFNYTNLSIARSFRRSKEIGIRKVIGALKGHVVGQFIAEAVIISVLALILSMGLFLLLRPGFLSLAPELSNIVTLDLNWRELVYFLALAIAVGILAGVLPAIFFSRIRAVQVLKDVSSLKVFKNVAMRKVLIVVQYTFSMIFIAATVIGYKQYQHFLTFNLGYNTENVLNIKTHGNDPNVIMNELRQIPEVTMLSKSTMVTSVGSYWGEHLKYKDPHDSVVAFYNSIDENYIPIHGHNIIAGRNFIAKPDSAVESEVIVNEQVLKHFKIANAVAMDAVGEMIMLSGKPVEIIGVVKDFHYGKVDSDIRPFIFRYVKSDDAHVVNAKIVSNDLPATMATIEKSWKKFDSIHPLDATFYDDQIQDSYSEYRAMLKIIGFLAFLAVSIASMGLLGMVVFTTETRTKEISIRKVLGASEGNLIYLLSRGFLVLLLVSAVFALPATYLFFDQFALESIVYRAPISVMELFIALAVVMVIAFVMIGSQTVRVARSNPAEVLKAE